MASRGIVGQPTPTTPINGSSSPCKLSQPGDLPCDMALSHWNCLRLHAGAVWQFFCHFVPVSKTSSFALAIPLAYHSEVYFFVIFTIVSLWRTKPCTRISLRTETLTLKIWCIPYLQRNLKGKAKISPLYIWCVRFKRRKNKTPSTFPFKRMLFTRGIHFFNISTTKTQLILKLVKSKKA